MRKALNVPSVVLTGMTLRIVSGLVGRMGAVASQSQLGPLSRTRTVSGSIIIRWASLQRYTTLTTLLNRVWSPDSLVGRARDEIRTQKEPGLRKYSSTKKNIIAKEGGDYNNEPVRVHARGRGWR